ncbi:hypothetical protein [Novipirellula sp.]|uniref:hypothetical protein n=1 Tax=Novipirellula sp. TaxID=2795430 RepID=UPI003563F8DD
MTWSKEAENSPIGEQTDAILPGLRTRVLNDHIETSHFGRGHVRYPTEIAAGFLVAPQGHQSPSFLELPVWIDAIRNQEADSSPRSMG